MEQIRRALKEAEKLKEAGKFFEEALAEKLEKEEGARMNNLEGSTARSGPERASVRSKIPSLTEAHPLMFYKNLLPRNRRRRERKAAVAT